MHIVAIFSILTQPHAQNGKTRTAAGSFAPENGFKYQNYYEFREIFDKLSRWKWISSKSDLFKNIIHLLGSGCDGGSLVLRRKGIKAVE